MLSGYELLYLYSMPFFEVLIPAAPCFPLATYSARSEYDVGFRVGDIMGCVAYNY